MRGAKQVLDLLIALVLLIVLAVAATAALSGAVWLIVHGWRWAVR